MVNSDMYIKKIVENELNSISYINYNTYNSEINSTLVISYYEFGEIYDETWKELMSNEEFVNSVVYRKYDEDSDNITGDLDRDDYNDYDIDINIELLEDEDEIVKTGQLNVGDVNIFMPSKIDVDSDGNKIEPAFRPKKRDRIFWNSYEFQIESIKAERVGNIEIFMDIYAKRVDNLRRGRQ